MLKSLLADTATSRGISRVTSTPLTRSYASGQAVKQQLERVAQLQREASATNSKHGKEALIASYPDLRALLDHVYDPHHRANLTSASLRKYAATRRASDEYKGSVPGSINELFELLASREVSGNAAKDMTLAFLSHAGITDLDSELGITFARLLDRNLVAGFGARTLRAVNWADDATEGHHVAATPSSTANTVAAPESKTTGLSQEFSVALGKTIKAPFTDLRKASKWYASRKLDGVRVVSYVDVLLPPSGTPEVVSTRFLSRNGRDFHALSKLGKELSALGQLPQLREWLDRDRLIVESRGSAGDVKRLVLDGEVCVLLPKSGDIKEENEEDFVEDFSGVVGEMRRQGHTIPHPAYFIFDVLSFAEFDAHSGLPPPLGRSFGQRIPDIETLVKWLNAQVSDVSSRVIRPLEQWEVTDLAQVEGMVGKAAERGWEGLIFRADKAYNGKRSSDVRKFKQWQDAEYVVQSIDTSVMRLAVKGVFGEHTACSNVWVDHGGTPVSVGSGFTAEQRLAYARDPTLIIGKEITVEYFSESEAAGRPGMKSLRFPRIKKVWDEGVRDI